MKLDSSLAAVVKSQLPDFIRSDYPVFAEFLKAYYKFLEQNLNQQEVLQNITKYHDIDKTIALLVSNFFNIYAENLPKEIEANVGLFIKKVKHLYNSKGTEKSFQLLFSILYNETIDFLYPWDYTIKPSTGNWVKAYSIKVFAVDTDNPKDIFLLENSKIIGEQTNTTAVVNKVLRYRLGSYDVFELFLDGETINGKFNIHEIISSTVKLSDGTSKTISGIIYPALKDVDVIDGGAGYKVGQNVTITSNTGVNAFAEITSVDIYGKILNVKSQKTGVNYFIGNTTVTAPLPESNLNGTYYLLNDIINISFNTGHGLKYGSNVNLEFSGGSNYISGTYQNNIIKAIKNYQSFDVKITGIESATEKLGNVKLTYNDLAQLTPAISGLLETEGNWKNSIGKLSENMYFQGRKNQAAETEPPYFQPFSYVIKSTRPISEWKKYVKDILNPAGMIFFGDVLYDVDRNNVIEMEHDFYQEIYNKVIIMTDTNKYYTDNTIIRADFTFSLGNLL